jgi:Type VI secretion system, TssN
METSSAELQHGVSVQTNNSWSLSASIRHTVFYPAILILISLTVNYCFGLYILPAITGASFIYAGIFFLIGLLHIVISQKWLFHLWHRHFTRGTVYTIVLAVIIGFTSFILFSLGIEQSKLWIIAAVAATSFLLPYALYATIHYFRSIGSRQYEPWFIPPDVEPDTRMSLILNSIHFKIKINIKDSDIHPTQFIITLSPKLTLSAVFLRFLYDKHDIIEMTGSNGYPYGWLFSIKKKFGKKMLDPDLTLIENGVREDDVIVVERILE